MGRTPSTCPRIGSCTAGGRLAERPGWLRVRPQARWDHTLFDSRRFHSGYGNDPQRGISGAFLQSSFVTFICLIWMVHMLNAVVWVYTDLSMISLSRVFWSNVSTSILTPSSSGGLSASKWRRLPIERSPIYIAAAENKHNRLAFKAITERTTQRCGTYRACRFNRNFHIVI